MAFVRSATVVSLSIFAVGDHIKTLKKTNEIWYSIPMPVNFIQIYCTIINFCQIGFKLKS